MGIEQWSPTAADNVLAKTGINFDEGQAPSSVNDSARSLMADVKEWHIDAEWLKLGENGNANAYSISFVSTTVFKFVGTDRRTLAPIHRRVKAGVGAGVIYGTISESSLSASDTQITVAWDSGQLDSSLSFVSLGIISPTNTSHPRDMDMSFSDVAVKGQLSFASGATITGNPDVSLSDVTITGTVTGLTGASGGSMVLLATGTASNSASLNFTGLTGYYAYRFVLTELAPQTDNVGLYIRTSTDNGSNYDTGGYGYAFATSLQGGAVGQVEGAAQAQIVVTNSVGNAAGESVSGEILFTAPAGTHKCFTGTVIGLTNSGNFYSSAGGGRSTNAGTVNAVQFLFSSGNIVSGSIKVYGIKSA